MTFSDISGSIFKKCKKKKEKKNCPFKMAPLALDCFCSFCATAYPWATPNPPSVLQFSSGIYETVTTLKITEHMKRASFTTE